jgi:outer membrane protein
VPSLASVLEAALTGNFDLLVARANLQSAGVDVAVARNGKLPQLDATLSGGPLGTNGNAGPAFAQMGRFGAFSMSASLQLTQPTLNRTARGLDVAARAARRKADLNETSVRQLVQANATRALSGAANAGRRMALLSPMSDVAHRDLEAERARFTAGRSTNFDVLRRQDEVAQVELRRLRARVDYAQSMATVQALTGEILPRLGVTLK